MDGGAQVAEEVRNEVTELRDDLADARTQLEQAESRRRVRIGRAGVADGNVVGALGNNTQAINAIDGNLRLNAAFDQAESCERLRAIQTPGG